MPVVLVKEDGTGKANANTYALPTDGDAYHEGHLYGSVWAATSASNKEIALAMATRLIDTYFQFNGFKRLSTQALQWPRRICRDPDIEASVIPGVLLAGGPYVDETKVPAQVINATAEVARELLKADRTDDPEGEGISQLNVSGAVGITFDKRDRQPVIPYVAQTMLSKFGVFIGPSDGMVRLVRV